MINFNPDKIKRLLNERRNNDIKFRQNAFLKEVKLSLPGLNKILEGKSIPSVSTLLRIATFFDRDMNYFFDNINLPEEILASKKEEEVNNDFLLSRIEKMAVQINKLEEELKQYRDSGDTSYTLQNVPDFKASKSPSKLIK